MTLNSGSDVIKEDSWNHVVMTYDNTASQINVYVDGQLVGQKSATIDVATTGGFKDIEFGEDVNGIVDDIEIYNRALNSDDAIRLSTMGRYAKSTENTYHNVRVTDFKHSPNVIEDQQSTRTYSVTNAVLAKGVIAGTRALELNNNGKVSFGTDDIVSNDSDEFTVSAWVKLNNSTTTGQKILHKTGVIDFYIDNAQLHLKLGGQTVPITPVASPGIPEIDDNIFPEGLVRGQKDVNMPVNASKITLSAFVKKNGSFNGATRFNTLFALGQNNEINIGLLRSGDDDYLEVRMEQPSLVSSAYINWWEEFSLGSFSSSSVDKGYGCFENLSGTNDLKFELTLQDSYRRATMESITFKCPMRASTPSRVRISSKENSSAWHTILDMPITFKSSSHVYQFVMGHKLNVGTYDSSVDIPFSDVVKVEFLRNGGSGVKVDDLAFSTIIEETIRGASAVVTDGYQTVTVSGTVTGHNPSVVKVYKSAADRDADSNAFMTVNTDANGYFSASGFDGRASGDNNAKNGRDDTYYYYFAKHSDGAHQRRVFSESVSAYLKEQYSLTETSQEVLKETDIAGGERFSKIRFRGKMNCSGLIRIYKKNSDDSYTSYSEVAVVRDQAWQVDRTTETAEGTYVYRYWFANTPPGQSTRYHWAAEFGQSNSGFNVYIYNFTFNLSTSQIYVRRDSNNFSRPTYSGSNYHNVTHNESSFNKNQATTQTITYTAANSRGSGSISRNLSVVVYNVSANVANSGYQNVKVGANHHTLGNNDYSLTNMEHTSSSGYPGIHSGGNDTTYTVTHYFRDTRDHNHTTSVTTTIRKYKFTRTTFKNISSKSGQQWGWHNMVSSWGTNSSVTDAVINYHPWNGIHATDEYRKNHVGSHPIAFHTKNSITGGEGHWDYATAHVAPNIHVRQIRVRLYLNYYASYSYYSKTRGFTVRDQNGRTGTGSYNHGHNQDRYFYFNSMAGNIDMELWSGRDIYQYWQTCYQFRAGWGYFQNNITYSWRLGNGDWGRIINDANTNSNRIHLGIVYLCSDD